MHVLNSRAGAVALAVLVFGAIWVSLGWMEFTNGSEKLNVATVLEIKRDGLKWIPTLNTQPRLAKPPYTAWITGVFVRDSTLAKIGSADETAREYALMSLEYEVRLPALLAGCATLLLTCWMARMLLGEPSGVIALCVAGSSILFFRFTRTATTDIQLAMLVSLASAMLVMVVMKGSSSWWLWACGAVVGVAILTKGPVAIVQTVMPIAAFATWNRLSPLNGSAGRSNAMGWVGLIVAMLAVALPWPVSVLMRMPNALDLWRAEITREGATTLAADPFYSYVDFPIWLTPWVALFVAGIVIAFQRGRNDPTSRLLLCMLFVPVIVMSVAKDKNERYLLPLLPAASMLVVLAVTEAWKASTRVAALLRAQHWFVLLAAVIGVPVASIWLKGLNDQPWLSVRSAINAAGIGLLLWIVSFALARRDASRTAIATLVLMLFTGTMFMAGYRKTDDGRSDMKPLADRIWRERPTARLWNYDRREPGKQLPVDLCIYLNRNATELADASQLPTGGDHVLLVVQRRSETPPEFAGWKELTRSEASDRTWWVMVPAAP